MSVTQPKLTRLIAPEIRAGWLLPGVLAFAAGILLALLVAAINNAWADQPERAVSVVAALFVLLLGLVMGGYLLVRGRAAEPAQLALMGLGAVGVLLLAVYLYQVSFWVRFPADFLIWSESEFVNDILKFRVGYPIYSAQVNNESFIYTPGAPLLTYFISILLGNETSIPLYRGIQLGYLALAAVIGVFTVRALVVAKYPSLNYTTWFPWGVICLPILFLVATNSITNPFVHNLHNDALAVLVSSTGFFLLVKYALSGNKKLLLFMAVVPLAGFLVKQPLLVWAALYLFYLVFFDRPFSFTRTATFGLAAFGLVALAIAGGVALWGDNFIYWMFQAAGSHDYSLLRSFQHVLDTWPYLAIGLVGGMVFFRGKELSPYLGLCSVWLLLLMVEVYTSGIGWTLSHLGPASFISGVWFVAALIVLWSEMRNRAENLRLSQRWLGSSMAAVVLMLLFSGLGMIRIPTPPFSADAYRYVSEVEAQFQGVAAESVLLDSGTWVYLNQSVVVKDRVTSIGDRGRGETGDFSGILQRIEQQSYAKVLVRNFNSPDFWYDHASWNKPSGIRQALQAHYREVGVIEGVEGEKRYLFSDISILVPRPREDTQLSTRSTSDRY